MCKISDKIKFCTCKAKSSDSLKNYWVFHRYDKGRFDGIVGTCNLPVLMDEDIVNYNEETLLKRVNEVDAFDIDLQPKNKDRLEIVLNCKQHFGGDLHIGFEYKKGQWVACEYDLFEWTWKHTEDAFGKLK
jgi:hypothetical protein